MKYLIAVLGLSLLLSACTQENEKSTEKVTENKISTKTVKDKSIHQEFFENGKLKMEGKFDENGEKTGLWISYHENGNKNSEAHFKNGVSSGYSMVWYPNGAVMYYGDYVDGEKVGTWMFYDKNGKFVKEETF